MKNLLFAVLFISGSAIGQKRIDTIIYPNEKVIVETDTTITNTGSPRFLFNSFWDNWFVMAGAGGNIFFGNEDHLKPWHDRVTLTYELSFGKWIHPAMGLRAKVGGGLIRSYSTGTLPVIGHSLIVGGPDANGVYTQRWHHVYVEADFMVDLCNAIGGYKPMRFYSVIPYAGAGLDIVLNQPKYDGDRSGIAVLGVINRFRLSPSFDINVELKGTVVKQGFDRENSTKDFEFYAAATAGLTYNFGGNKLFKKGSNKQVAINQSITHIPNIPVKEPTQVVKEEKETVREVMVEKKLVLSHPMAVFFELNRSDISDRSKVNLAFVAEIIKSSGGAKFRLIGSADNKTASPRYNQALSQRRSLAVRDYLTKVLLVEPDQLITDPIGGSDRFSPPMVNRTVIIKQE